MRAQILTPYIGDGLTLQTAYRPLLADLWPLAWTDATGTPNAQLIPDVNLLVVDVVCDAATLDAISADSRFEVLYATE